MRAGGAAGAKGTGGNGGRFGLKGPRVRAGHKDLEIKADLGGGAWEEVGSHVQALGQVREGRRGSVLPL